MQRLFAHTLKDRCKDDIWFWGLLFLMGSLGLYVIEVTFLFTENQGFGVFLAHYVLTLAYFIILLVSRRLKKGREGLQPMFLFLMLFLVSAYSLNRSIHVFDASVNWFSTTLVLIGVNYLLFAFFEQLSVWLRYLLCFIVGIALVVFAYLAFYLVPTYAVSVAGFFVLGFSLHSFVPLLFCIYTIVLIRKNNRISKSYGRASFLGIGITAAFVIGYIAVWSIKVKELNKAYNQTTTESPYPAWVSAASVVTPGLFSERILKSGIVYRTASFTNDWLFNMPSAALLNDIVKHDPLVMVASLFSPNIEIPDWERAKMLDVLFDVRHQTELRFWRDKNLETTNVNTDVEIWPDLHLAYTQLDLTVADTRDSSGFRNSPCEALYSFHLPEGAVVTSLSLWIGEEERKALLTTKAKADSAYKTVVGVERKDPSVVHWQEGNRVTVRVFPVEQGDRRRFRLGVTMPLQAQGNQIMYRPPYFEGPDANDARQRVSVSFIQKPRNCTINGLLQQTDQHYVKIGPYHTNWWLSFDKPKVHHDAFSFAGKQYRLFDYKMERALLNCKEVYLDVNSEWNKEEWRMLNKMLDQKTVFVANEQSNLVQLTTENNEEWFNRLTRRRFSLFPFYAIYDKSAALVISKSNNVSPILRDLHNTSFADKLGANCLPGEKIRLFNMSPALSPYLRSLKQAGLFEYESGSLSDLQQLLETNRLAVTQQVPGQVVLENAGLAITAEDSSWQAMSRPAPDHLMRLYAYNHILQQGGVPLLTGKDFSDSLLAHAEQAYVVSPLSSLIVLETQHDYDRFNIKASQNSLENAALLSKGSVPEPHEWALMIVVLLTLLFVKYKHRLAWK